MSLHEFVAAWNHGVELQEAFPEMSSFYTAAVQESFNRQFTSTREPMNPGALRMSALGKPGVYLGYNKLHPPTSTELIVPFKRSWIFFSGDMFEALMGNVLAHYGFDVTGLQTEVEYRGIKGHIDGFANGQLIECKAMSDWSWNTFVDKGITDDNSSGYATQLNMYQHCLNQDIAYWLILNKQTGELAIIENEYDDDYRDRVDYILEVLPQIETDEDILEHFTPPDPVYDRKTKKYLPPWSIRDLPADFLRKCYPQLEIRDHLT
jgi:hypothetical protein